MGLYTYFSHHSSMFVDNITVKGVSRNSAHRRVPLVLVKTRHDRRAGVLIMETSQHLSLLSTQLQNACRFHSHLNTHTHPSVRAHRFSGLMRVITCQGLFLFQWEEICGRDRDVGGAQGQSVDQRVPLPAATVATVIGNDGQPAGKTGEAAC